MTRGRDFWIGAGALAVAGVAALWGGGRVVASGRRYDLASRLAFKWATVFPRVSALTILAVMAVESSFRPDAANTADPRAAGRGGAFGLMGMTRATAIDLLPRIARAALDPALSAPARERIRATLARFPDPAAALADPDVNALFGAFYLDTLAKEFGNDLKVVVAAYHAGGPAVARHLAKGQTVPGSLGPLTREYVAKVLEARSDLQEREVA